MVINIVVDFTASTGGTTPSVSHRSTATPARQCRIIIYYCKCNVNVNNKFIERTGIRVSSAIKVSPSTVLRKLLNHF